jgi:uncharacterized membrane protein (DUF106 family)
MPRVAEKLQTLLEEDEEIEDAVSTILNTAKQDGGEFRWEDVEDEVSSGQWGRLIQKDIIVNTGGDDFEFADQEAVKRALDGDVDLDLDLPEVDAEESSWSQWDKIAGLTTVSMMIGYYYQPVQEIIGALINLFIGPLDAVLPFYMVILCLATLTGLYSGLLQSALMDMEKMSQYRERMQAMQEKQKEARERGDDAELDQLQEKQMEMMGEQLGMFKEQFRPMVWITVLTIPIFLWMRWQVAVKGTGAESMMFPMIGERTWNNGILGPLQGWILWYFVCSMAFGQLLRKSLNISATPS